ncbi:MAG: MBL fold metallo-hydrolase [Candidatus Saccharibacteria bacterium]
MEIIKTKNNGFLISSKAIDVAIDSPDDKSDVSLNSAPQPDAPKSDSIVFDSQGEYEVKSCMIDAIPVIDGKCGFSLITEGVRAAYLPEDVKEVLSDDQVEAFSTVDILIVPVIGEKAEITTKIINQIEPKIIIPHSYKEEQLKLLAAEFGSDYESVSKFKISKKELSETEQQRLVVLN